MPFRRPIILIACFIILSAIILSVHQIGKERPEILDKLLPSKTAHGGKGGKASDSCTKDIRWLANLDIHYPVNYAERDIIVRANPQLKRESLTKIDETLFSKPRKLDQDHGNEFKLRGCKSPLFLDVPSSPAEPVDFPEIAFGMATTLERLEDSKDHIARWLAHATKASLYITIITPDQETVPPTPEQLESQQAALRAQGMPITLLPPINSTLSFTENYFSLVKTMYAHAPNTTAWFTLMDDDTFFPSLLALKTVLAKYNPDEQHYIGAVSESWWSVARYGMMAFGGAGIFLSHALTAALDAAYETCTEEMHPAAGGDERVMRCIHGHTTTKLTNEPALHQMDISGDLSGVYESGRFPLSLHHWKGGEYPVDRMHLVSDICGDCFLQRWQFGKDTVFSNGFSIVQYPGVGDYALGNMDLSQAEETWDSKTVEDSVNPGTAHSMSPIRPKLDLDKQKVQHRLVNSAVVEDGSVRQTYIHKRLNEEDLDTVLVLYWKKEEEEVVEEADTGTTNTTSTLKAGH
ncbi:MAG: hypothetical protein Q9219_003339 [cf. Caloplaca sp. 3 TL-2023]